MSYTCKECGNPIEAVRNSCSRRGIGFDRVLANSESTRDFNVFLEGEQIAAACIRRDGKVRVTLTN